VSVCLSICPLACLKDHTSKLHEILRVNRGRGSVLLWRQCNTLCTSGFVDDAIFDHFVCVCVCVCVSVFLPVCYYCFFSDCRIYLFSSLAARVSNKLTRIISQAETMLVGCMHKSDSPGRLIQHNVLMVLGRYAVLNPVM